MGHDASPLLALDAPLLCPLVAVASIQPGNGDGTVFRAKQDCGDIGTLSSTALGSPNHLRHLALGYNDT